MVPWVGLQCVIVVFPDHTHLLFSGIADYLQVKKVCEYSLFVNSHSPIIKYESTPYPFGLAMSVSPLISN